MKDGIRKAPLITALEQRILLDAAGVVTGAEVIEDDGAEKDAALADAAALAPQTRERREVAFVDGGLEDVDTLIADLPDSTEVVVVDSARNGFKAMAAYLDGQSGVDAVHVFGHGAAGQATLGTATLDAGTLDIHADALRGIGDALTEAGDILLYGCYVGAGPEGEAFVEDIAALTSADVTASDDLTGAAALGGDWELEVSEGVLEFNSLELLGYQRTLVQVGTIQVLSDDDDGGDKDNLDVDGVAKSGGSDSGTLEPGNLDKDGDFEKVEIVLNNSVASDQTWSVTVDGGSNGNIVSTSGTGPGTYRITEFDVGGGGAWSFTLDEAPNTAPSGNGSQKINVNEDDGSGSIQLNASDPDGDSLAWSLSDDSSPAGVSNLSVTLSGLVNFDITSSLSKKGPEDGNATFTVSDGFGGTTTDTLNISIRYDNDTITTPQSIADSSFRASGTGFSKSFSDWASDPDAVDSVRYTATKSGTAKDVFTVSNSTDNVTLAINPGSDRAGESAKFNVTATSDDDSTAPESFTVSLGTARELNDMPETSNASFNVDEDSSFAGFQWDGSGSGNFSFSDADAGGANSFDHIEITKLPEHGVLRFDGVDQTSAFVISSSSDLSKLKYIPDPDFNGSDSFEFHVNDGLEDSSTQTMTITVDPVNDAPVLNAAGGADFTTITEDDVTLSDTNNIGDTVEDLLDGQVSDTDAGQPSTQNQNPNGADNGKELGMAIFDETIVGPGDGYWEYWIDDGTSGYTDDANWNGLSEQGKLDESDALLLGPNDRLRFNPDGERGNGGEPDSSDYYDANAAAGDTAIAEQVPNPAAKSSLRYYAWDGSGGFELNDNDERRADVTSRDSGNGSTTSPFSFADDTTGIAVQDRNDTPSLVGVSVGNGDRFDLTVTDARGSDTSLDQYGITDAEFVDFNSQDNSVSARLTDPDKNDDPDNGLEEIDYAGYRVEIARKAPNGDSAESWSDLSDANTNYGNDGLAGSEVDQFGFDFRETTLNLKMDTGADARHNAAAGATVTLDGHVVAEVLSAGTDYFEIEFRNTGDGTGTDETRATQEVVDAILQSITYRAEKPYGDARFKMTVKDVPYPYSTDDDADTMDARETAVGEFEVRSKNIFVTQVDETGTDEAKAITRDPQTDEAKRFKQDIDSADGITLREAVIIAERQGGERVIHMDGTHTVTEDLLIEATTDSTIHDITLQLDGDTTLNVQDGITLTIDAEITGKGTLTKTGDGTLILNDDNAFGSGRPDITVVQGTLAGHAEALGGAASNTIDVKANARLLIVQGDDSAVEGGPSGVTDQDDATLGATLTGSGVIEKSGDGLLTLNSTKTDHDGVFIVNEGVVKAAVTGALGNQSTVEIHGGDGLNSAGGALEIAASQTIGELRSDHTADGDNALLTIVDGELLTVDQTTDSTFTGQITGAGGLVKTGGGTLTLDNFDVDTTRDAPPNEATGESDYTGDTSVEAGTLVATGRSIGDLSSVSVHGGATLRITGDEEIGSFASVENEDGEAIVEIDDGDGTEEAGTPTLTTGGNGEDTTFAGQIGGEGGLTKTGSGGMTLDTTGDTGEPGGNTFAGPLTVEEGDVTTKGGKSIGDGTPVEVIDPGTLNVDDSEEIGSLNGDGEVNIGGDTEIGQGLTARLEARLRPNVEDAVNVGDRIEYTLTIENTSGSDIAIDAVGNDLGVDFDESGGDFPDDTPFTVEPDSQKTRTFTAFYTLKESDLSPTTPSPIDIKVTLDPDDDAGDDITPIELTDSTELTPNTPSDVLTIGGDDTSTPLGDGGSFGGTTSGPGGLNVTAPGGLTVEGPEDPVGDLGHDGGTVVGNGGGLTNKGKISGEGDITVKGGDDGTDPETPGGTFKNEGTITDGDGDSESDDGDGGDVNVLGPNGDFDNEPGGTVEGDVDNDGGTVTNGGTIGGDVENSGDGAGFTNEDGGTVEGDVDNEDGGTVDNEDGGTIKGDVTSDGGGVTNGGTVKGGVTVTGGGSFDNEEGGTVEGNVEVDDGTFDNDGTVGGDVTYIPPSGNVSGDGEITGTVSPEEFIVDLHGTIDRGKNGKIDAGDTITYTMTVTNKTIEELDFDKDGGLDVDEAKVYDSSTAALQKFQLVSQADGDNNFAEGETWVYTAEVTLDQAVFDGNGTDEAGVFDGDGDIDQFVKVTGTSKEGKTFFGTDTAETALRDDLDVDVRQSGRVIDVDGDGFVTAADRIDYVTKVRNTGNLAIAPTDPGFEITGQPSPTDLSRQSSFDDGADDTLSAGEVWTYTHSYQLTESDLGNGPITGGASFDGTVVAGSDTVTETATSSVALKIADAPETRSVIDPKSDTSATARLTVGGLVMEPDGVNKFDIAGTDPEQTAADGGHDQIRVTGDSASVRLNGAELRVNLIDGAGGSAPFIPARGESFVLIDNNANAEIEGKFTYAADNDRGRFTDGTDNDAPINTDGATRTTVEEGDILRFDGYDFRISYIGDTDGDGTNDGTNDEGPHDVTLTRVNMYPEVLADAEDRYNDGQGARLHSYPASVVIDGTGLAPADRASGSKEADYDADAAGLVTIDLGADAHATEIDLSARDTHSDFEVVAEAGEDNQETLATDDIVNLPFKVSGTLGLYDPDSGDSLALAGEEDGNALAAEKENGVTAVTVEHYVSTEDANGGADVLSVDPRQPDAAMLRGLFSASIDGTAAEAIQGDFSGTSQQAATATLSWTFDASGQAAAAFDYLDKNEVVDITYTVRVTDGQTVTWDIARENTGETNAYTEHAVTIRVIGTNDPVKVLVNENGEAPNVDHLWQFGRDYLDNDEGRELNVFTISTEGREEVTPISDGDRVYDVSRLFVDRDVTEDRDATRDILERGAPGELAERAGLRENIFFTITSTKSSTGEVIEGPTPQEMFKTDSKGDPLWGQLKPEFEGGTAQGMLPGLTLDVDTGVISGRPIDIGTYVIEVTAIDSDGATTKRSFELLIVAPPDAVVVAPPRETPPAPPHASDVVLPELERERLPSGLFDGRGFSENAADASAILQPEAQFDDGPSASQAALKVFVRADGTVVFETSEIDAKGIDFSSLEAEVMGNGLVINIPDTAYSELEKIEVFDLNTGYEMSGAATDVPNGRIVLSDIIARGEERLELALFYADGRIVRLEIDLDLEAFEDVVFKHNETLMWRPSGEFRESARIEMATTRSAAVRYDSLLAEVQ